MKKKLECKSKNKLFKPYLEYAIEQGQHEIGLMIGNRDLIKEGEYQINIDISEKEFKELVSNDEGIKEVELSHHSDERGLYFVKWYFVMYEDKQSSRFKPTKLNASYEDNLEIVVSFGAGNGKYLTRTYTYKHLKDECYPESLCDIDIERIFKEMIDNEEQGLSGTCGYDINIELFDSVGSKTQIETRLSEIIDNIVCIRYV